MTPEGDWVRRARPVMGTLVEIGVPHAQAAHLPALWAVLDTVVARMSVHAPDSDLSRLNRSEPHKAVQVAPWTAAVLHLAQAWQQACSAFDVAQGSGPWRIRGEMAMRLGDATRLDLGGLAKGWAVDRVVDAARDLGLSTLWVNAGGDLRAQGVDVPVVLRDEHVGGVRPFGVLRDAAMATSDFRAGARAKLWRADGGDGLARHVSVLAGTCVTADALTKVIAAWGLGDPRAQVLLQAHRAQAWVHDAGLTPTV